MKYRIATTDDLSILAKMNKELAEDEQHRNRFMSIPELEERMRGFLKGKYEAIIFEDAGEIVAYALFCDNGDHIYLRQLFVSRDHRRRGIGRKAMEILKNKILSKNKRITVEVLSHNKSGYAFWRAVGFKDHSIELEMPVDEKGLP
jgi:ribosomal protein S18 acetylase RimI-like enzyme